MNLLGFLHPAVLCNPKSFVPKLVDPQIILAHDYLMGRTAVKPLNSMNLNCLHKLLLLCILHGESLRLHLKILRSSKGVL